MNAFKKKQSLSSLILVTFLGLAALYFVGLGNTGLFDVDEAIFAQASYEMVETGDYVTPHYNGDPRYHKPPLIYWVQAFFMDNFGKDPFFARLPSAIFAFLTVVGFYVFLSGMTKNARFALTASAVLGANMSFLVISQASTADMSLNFFTLMATLTLVSNMYAERRSWAAPVIAGFVLALAMLAKGPVSLMVPGIVVGTLVLVRPGFVQNLRCVNPFLVVGAMVVGLIPWLNFVVEAKGWDFFEEFWFVHNLGRFTEAMGNTQSGSHFYYLGVLLFGFFPWILLVPTAINWVRKGFVKNLRSDRVEDVLPAIGLIWAVVVVAFFSFSATKLPHYILPAYAGLALLVAGRLEVMWNKPVCKLNLVWVLPITFLFSFVFVILTWLPDILLQRFENLPIFLQAFINRVDSLFGGIQWKDVEFQTMQVLTQDVSMGVGPLALGLIALFGSLVGVFFVMQRNRQGVVVLAATAWMMMLVVVTSVSPSIYAYIQQPLANIGERISDRFVEGEDKVYFYAIHQPSVRFVSGVPFENVARPQDLWDVPANVRRVMVVLKHERAERMYKALPKMLTNVYCEGGYCLMMAKTKDMRDFAAQIK